MIEDYESSISEKERKKLIQEIQNWVRYRYKGLWFEKVGISMLLEIDRLQKEIDDLKSRDQ